MEYQDYNQQLWDMGRRFVEESGQAWECYARMAMGVQNRGVQNKSPDDFR